MPIGVQISIPAVLPWARAMACETAGAKAENTANSTASHTAQGRYSGVRCGVAAVIGKPELAYCLCIPWFMAGVSPALAPGAAVATGTLSSALVSTPLASLNTRMTGMVLSFCSVDFKSISITW